MPDSREEISDFFSFSYASRMRIRSKLGIATIEDCKSLTMPTSSAKRGAVEYSSAQRDESAFALSLGVEGWSLASARAQLESKEFARDAAGTP